MSADAGLEFWFDFASTYSYLSAVRLADRKDIVWRAFLLGPIFNELHGTSDSPFNRNPKRGSYMWIDIAREAAALGVPFRKPSAFPRGSLFATRIALLAADEPWIGAFVRCVFEANFVHDRDIGDEAVIVECLRASADESAAARFASEAKGPEAKARLFERTNEAKARGIFGAPTFFAKGELYWGNDRLAAADAANGIPSGWTSPTPR